MKKTKDTNKGITLIALVITIIVMLILVAVTITMAVNGGLFDYASSAGTKTNTATEAEQEYVNLETNMSVNQLIDKYTGWTEDDEQGGIQEITFTVSGKQYTARAGMTWAQWIDDPEYEEESVGFSYGPYYDAGDRVFWDRNGLPYPVSILGEEGCPVDPAVPSDPIDPNILYG